MDSFRFILGILDLMISMNVCSGFMTGAPNWSCKDPSTFHTLRLNASHEGIIMPQEMKTNPYRVEVVSETFTPGSRVTVTIHGGAGPDQSINGFFIQAIQAGISIFDLGRQSFGVFENTTANERPSKCQPINGIPRGGATHTNSAPKKSVSVVWLAPQEYNPGPVQFLVTGVKDYSTYWTDIRSAAINPIGYPSQEEVASFYWTPTASWYRWLQYVQQQQLLLDYISQSSDPQSAVANQKAGTLQNAESVAKKAEPSYKTANGTSKAESIVKNIELNPKTVEGKSGQESSISTSTTSKSNAEQSSATSNATKKMQKAATSVETTSKPIVN